MTTNILKKFEKVYWSDYEMLQDAPRFAQVVKMDVSEKRNVYHLPLVILCGINLLYF